VMGGGRIGCLCGVLGRAEHSGFELRRKHVLQGKVFMELIGKQ